MGRASREGDTLYAILTIIFMVIFTLAAAFAVLSLIGGRITFDNKSVDPTVEVLPVATSTVVPTGPTPTPLPEIVSIEEYHRIEALLENAVNGKLDIIDIRIRGNENGSFVDIYMVFTDKFDGAYTEEETKPLARPQIRYSINTIR